MPSEADSNPAASGSPAPALPWYRQRQALVSAYVVLGLGLVGLLYWFFFMYPYVSTDDARVAADLARVAPEGSGGLVLKVDVSEGDSVRAGQALVELDPAQAQAELEAAQAKALLASKDLQRGEELAAEHGLAPRQLDMARANAAEADAGLRLAQLALDRCVLRSPFDAVVLEKQTDVGNHIETGQTAVTVADLDGAWVSANIEETDFGLVKVGQKATLSVDEGGSLEGRVIETGGATLSTFAMIPSENSSGNFVKLVQRLPVKIALDPHPGRVLKVGQSVEVEIRVH